MFRNVRFKIEVVTESSCLTTHTENSVMQISICIIDDKRLKDFVRNSRK